MSTEQQPIPTQQPPPLEPDTSDDSDDDEEVDNDEVGAVEKLALDQSKTDVKNKYKYILMLASALLPGFSLDVEPYITMKTTPGWIQIYCRIHGPDVLY